jgi:hypothetical protein
MSKSEFSRNREIARIRSDLRLETYFSPLENGQTLLSLYIDIPSPAVESEDFNARFYSGGHVLTTWNRRHG